MSHTRKALREHLHNTLHNPETLLKNIKDINLPVSVLNWFQALSLLKGVPFNYLVADEVMLPLESIRFFYLDNNWINALIDGAFSIGRNLSDGEQGSYDYHFDKAVLPKVMGQIFNKQKNTSLKTKNNLAESDGQKIISGFLLRSTLVNEYPHIGVNAFPKGAGPDSGSPQLLTILRMEKLSSSSDTLICLIEGDAHQIEVHEPAQVLHFGIDCFNDNCTVNGNQATAVKNIRSFTLTPTINNSITTNSVNLTGNTVDVDISSCFRSVSPRVMEMTALANLILAQNNSSIIPAPTLPTILPTDINSAEMGFVMTEGVGMVSFINSGT